MKKILLAFNGRHFSEGAVGFAKALNKKSPIMLTGAFLPQVDYASIFSLWGGGATGPLLVPLVESMKESSSVRDNIMRFENFCEKLGIEHSVHEDFEDLAIPTLIRETRFSDLLIIGSETFFHVPGIDDPSEALKDTLHGVECPVIVVPEEFDFPHTNILAYDGSSSSVYAIKQFAYLFPELAINKTLLIHLSEKDDEELPERENIEELASRHFRNLSLTNFEKNSKEHLEKWLAGERDTILVCGAFGRSLFSRMIRKSFVSDIIKQHQIPVFIAHR